MAKITILEKYLNNNIGPKVILVMTYIKKFYLTKVLKK